MPASDWLITHYPRSLIGQWWHWPHLSEVATYLGQEPGTQCLRSTVGRETPGLDVTPSASNELFWKNAFELFILTRKLRTWYYVQVNKWWEFQDNFMKKKTLLSRFHINWEKYFTFSLSMKPALNRVIASHLGSTKSQYQKIFWFLGEQICQFDQVSCYLSSPCW